MCGRFTATNRTRERLTEVFPNLLIKNWYGPKYNVGGIGAEHVERLRKVEEGAKGRKVGVWGWPR